MTLPPLRGFLVFLPIVFLGNLISSTLRYPEIGSAILFPPYAALTVALVLSARRDWIWYILFAAVLHFTMHWPQWSISWVLLADVANIARALTAAILLRWLFGGPPALDNVREFILFTITVVVVAPAVGATLGAANVLLHNAAPDYWQPWRAWFVSNALTGLTLLPAIMLGGSMLAKRNPVRLSRWRAFELAMLVTALASTGAIFLSSSSHLLHPALFLYVPLPALIWAALRFGPGVASAGLTVSTFVAILALDRGMGAFLGLSLDDGMLALQLFVMTTSLTVLCIAAVNRARHNAAELYRALLASLPEHVAILDRSGMVLDVSDSWRRFAQDNQDDACYEVRPGHNYLDACRATARRGVISAGDALAGATNVLLGHTPRFEMEYDILRKGKREWYALTIDALQRPDGGAVVMRTDITMRREAAMELLLQQRELSHLSRVAGLGQLSGALAHELSQPLAAILANAQVSARILKRDAPDLNELHGILHDIVDESLRAVEVIVHIRGMLKRGETQMQSLEPRGVVDNVMKLAHVELIRRRVTAIVTVEPEVAPIVADRVQIQQVLLNLIINACDAMSVIPEADRKLVLTVRSKRNAVWFSVRDHGPGIPPEIMERLFDPFVTTKPEGLGLGLSISQTIVAAHQGRLWVENNDEGVTMSLALPCGGGANPEIPHPATQRSQSPEYQPT